MTATATRKSHTLAMTSPINEGGGFHPRNPRTAHGQRMHYIYRSMKAGAFTPAIPSVPVWREPVTVAQ